MPHLRGRGTDGGGKRLVLLRGLPRLRLTAEIRYERPAERLDAAQRAAHLWNIGKVLTDTPND